MGEAVYGDGTRIEVHRSKGQVVWKDFYGGEKNDFRRVGVKIVDISPEDMGSLENFLRTLIIRKATPELNISPRLLSALGLSNLKMEAIDD